MSFLRASYLKRTSAALLLSLFVFVHAVKAFHTHEYSFSSQRTHDQKDATLKADFSCSICDFQIAKDCDAVAADLQIQAPQQSIFFFYHYALPVYNSVIATSSGTDPPLLA